MRRSRRRTLRQCRRGSATAKAAAVAAAREVVLPVRCNAGARSPSFWRRPVRHGIADRACGSNVLAAACRGVAGGNVDSDGEAGNATATTPDSCCDAEEHEEYTGATHARVARRFRGSATRPSVSLLRREEPPRQRTGALGTHRRCRRRPLWDACQPCVRARTKDGAEPGRPARCRAPTWQPRARGGAGQSTSCWLGRLAGATGAAAAFWSLSRGIV